MLLIGPSSHSAQSHCERTCGGYTDSSMISRTFRSTSAARASDPLRPVAAKSDVGVTVEIKQPPSLLKMEIRQGRTVDTLISVCNARVAASGLQTSYTKHSEPS